MHSFLQSSEYEIKSLVADFDKVARKTIAKIKKGKNVRLYSRQQILQRCGLRSSERRTIDDEIETLIKGMDHDVKRLRGIINTYREKKGDKMGVVADIGSSIINDTQEMVERDKVQ